MKKNKPEKIEENKFKVKVEAHGWDYIKVQMAGPYGRAGRNDRIVLADYGVTVLFEFKREGKDAEKLQDYYHRKLKKLKHRTYVVYKASEAYRILIGLVKLAKRRFELEAKKRTDR